MKYLITVLALIALCVPAFGAGNPNIRCYISFDQSGAGAPVFDYEMTQYVGFKAYICFTGIEQGITTTTFRLNNPQVEYPGLFASQSFTNLMDIIVGDPYTGMSLASSTCRDGEIEVVGYLDLFPTAVGPATVEILDDPDFPRWVVDCTQPNGEVDFYCVFQNGSIDGGVPTSGDCPDPVEAATWGSIKSLYR